MQTIKNNNLNIYFESGVMVRQALSDHSGHDQTQEPRCFTLYLVLLKGLYVVVLNSGPQAPELYRFLFQPGPTKQIIEFLKMELWV